MNFFEHQAAARRATTRLVVLPFAEVVTASFDGDAAVGASDVLHGRYVVLRKGKRHYAMLMAAGA